MSLTKTGRVEGSSIVFPEPLPLPEGAEVTVFIHTVAHGAEAPSAAKTADSAFFGIWADRTDMEDSASWVQGQREKWQNRRD